METHPKDKPKFPTIQNGIKGTASSLIAVTLTWDQAVRENVREPLKLGLISCYCYPNRLIA